MFFWEPARLDFSPPTLATRLRKIHLKNHSNPLLIRKRFDRKRLRPSCKTNFDTTFLLNVDSSNIVPCLWVQSKRITV